MLARYREAEQRQLADMERSRVDKLGEDVRHCKADLDEFTLIREQCLQLKKELDETHNSQTLLIEKLIQCCKEVCIITSFFCSFRAQTLADGVCLAAKCRTDSTAFLVPSRRTGKARYEDGRWPRWRITYQLL